MPRTLVDADDPTAVREVTEAVVPLGPQSSQVAIKRLGTNGGGFNGRFRLGFGEPHAAYESPPMRGDAAHPPFALVFAFGRMVGDRRQRIARSRCPSRFSRRACSPLSSPRRRPRPAFSRWGGVSGRGISRLAIWRERMSYRRQRRRRGRRSRALLQQFGQRINQGHDSLSERWCRSLIGLGEVVGGVSARGWWACLASRWRCSLRA